MSMTSETHIHAYTSGSVMSYGPLAVGHVLWTSEPCVGHVYDL